MPSALPAAALTPAEGGLEVGAGIHPLVVELSDPAADDARLVGAKAANLAVARRRGLPVLPGFVLTTAASAGGLSPELIAALHPQWARLSRSGTDAVIVRSSSTIEDGRTSSMAGQFSTVPDVRGWDQFLEAIDTVLASAGGLPAAGMAVLIQPQLEAAGGGVLFSVDPITGDRRHFLVEAAADGPQSVVDGSAIATRMSLTPRGRLAGSIAGPDGLVLDRNRRHRLAGLARNVTAAFGIPQDIEWAFDDRGRLWLLQARPVTTVDNGGRSPVLGPGPLADTFPAPLRRLEQDLWLPPLRRGIAQALLIVGVVPRRRIDRSPLVIAVGGRVAADLDLLGGPGRHQSLLHRLDPRPPARRLRAAWRVGRLRRALPVLATDVIRQVDADLAAVPLLSQLSEEQLVNVLRRAGPVLEALHGYEVLAGMLLTPDHGGETGLSVALGTVASMRDSGISDAEIVARAPVALALIAPEVDAPNELPVVSHGPLGPGGGVDRLEPREALRLRTRWVQELTARAAAELGRSLEARGVLATGGAVTDLKLAELEVVVDGGAPPADLDQRASRPGPPLPADFRLTSTGAVIPER